MSTRRRHAVRGLYTVSERAVDRIKTDAGSMAPHIDPSTLEEKFQDPLYACFGTGGNSALSYRWKLDLPPSGPPPVQQQRILAGFGLADEDQPILVGYEYFSGLSATSGVRINAIRQKVDAYTLVHPWQLPSPKVGEFEPIRAYMWASYEKIENSVAALNKYKDYQAILDVVPGISSEEAKRRASEIMNALKSSGAAQAFRAVETAAREVSPVALAIAKGAAKAVGILSSDLTPDEKTALTLHAAADIISMIPVYGQVVGAAINVVVGVWDAQLAKDRAKTEAIDRDIAETYSTAYKKAAAVSLPVPWHAAQTFYPIRPAGWKTSSGLTPDQHYLRDVLERSFAIFNGQDRGALPGQPPVHDDQGLIIPQREAVKHWWALALMYMGDPKVGTIFSALGRDAFGGVIASDEQVMLVAAPIAVSHGWDIDRFARALYSYSAGWRGTPRSNAWGVGVGEVRRAFTEWDNPFGSEWSKRCTDKDGRPMVRNAWWLNWAVLAEDAFKLAETYNLDEALPGEHADEQASSIVMPAALGVGAGLVAINVLGLSGPVGWAVGLGAFLASNLLSSRD